MFKRFLKLFFLGITLLFFTGTTYASGITNYYLFVTPDYWTANNPRGNDLLLNNQQILEYNRQIEDKVDPVYSMKNYPDGIAVEKLLEFISSDSVLNDPLYREGKEVSERYKNVLREQINAKALIAKNIKVRHGVVVRRTNIRGMPTGEGVFYYPNDTSFDVFQEAVLRPCEPVAILHQSANGYFYYIQSYNYRGWVSRFDVAVTDKSTWLKYADPKDFLVVVAPNYNVKFGVQTVYCDMGTKLPIAAVENNSSIVFMPSRTMDGRLSETKVRIENNSAVNHGYLPYTVNNILRQAFKYYSTPYGWGDLQKGVDCSGFIVSVYRTMGIMLPRNGDQMELTPGSVSSFSGLDSEQRQNLVNTLKPGTVLFFDGHVMLYVGTSNRVPYIIHSLAAHYTNDKRNVEKRVLVSDLSLKRANGMTYLDELTTGIFFK